MNVNEQNDICVVLNLEALLLKALHRSHWRLFDVAAQQFVIRARTYSSCIRQQYKISEPFSFNTSWLQRYLFAGFFQERFSRNAFAVSCKGSSVSQYLDFRAYRDAHYCCGDALFLDGSFTKTSLVRYWGWKKYGATPTVRSVFLNYCGRVTTTIL